MHKKFKKLKKRYIDIDYIAQLIIIFQYNGRPKSWNLNRTAKHLSRSGKKLLIQHRATKLIRVNGRGDRTGNEDVQTNSSFHEAKARWSRISFNIAGALLRRAAVCMYAAYVKYETRGLHVRKVHPRIHAYGRARTTNRFRDGSVRR